MRIPKLLFKVPGFGSLAMPHHFSLALLPSLWNAGLVCYLSLKRQQHWQRSPIWVAPWKLKEMAERALLIRQMLHCQRAEAWIPPWNLIVLACSSFFLLWFILGQKSWLVYKLGAETLYCGQRHWSFREVQIYPKKLSQPVYPTWMKTAIPTGQPITSLPILSRALGLQNLQGQNQSWGWPDVIPFQVSRDSHRRFSKDIAWGRLMPLILFFQCCHCRTWVLGV